jgi:methylmalonyl-CoA mutase C-terminal domain/subunit
MELLREQRLTDVLVVVGGIIPDVDVPKLNAIGIDGIFLPGTPMQQIVDFISQRARTRAPLPEVSGTDQSRGPAL